MSTKIFNVYNHNGTFLCSADTLEDAQKEAYFYSDETGNATSIVETIKDGKTIDQRKEALIKREVDWAMDNMDAQEFMFLFKHGFKGFDNYTDEDIDRDYRSAFFD